MMLQAESACLGGGLNAGDSSQPTLAAGTKQWLESPPTVHDLGQDDSNKSAENTRLASSWGVGIRQGSAKSDWEASATCTPVQKQPKYMSRSPLTLSHLGNQQRPLALHHSFEALRVEGHQLSNGSDTRPCDNSSLFVVGKSISLPAMQQTPISKQAEESNSPFTMATPSYGNNQESFLRDEYDEEDDFASPSIRLSMDDDDTHSSISKSNNPPELLHVRDLQRRRHLDDDCVMPMVSFKSTSSRRSSGVFSPDGDGMDIDDAHCKSSDSDDPFTPTATSNILSFTNEPPPAPSSEKVHKLTLQGKLYDKEDFTMYLQRCPSALLYEAHYECQELLGKGSFGQVWKARHYRTKQLFALKKSVHKFRGTKDRDRLLREIQIVQSLKPHANLVRYYRAWQDGGHFYIVMDLCMGGTLKQLLQEHDQMQSTLGVEHIRVLSAGMLNGLHVIHSTGLLHLDLKPDNLFLMDNKRRIKIGDFGLCLPAKDWDEEEGDREYIDYDILNNHASSATDIFSAGLIIFQMLLGIVKLPGCGEQWHYLRSGNVDVQCHPSGMDIAYEVKRMLSADGQSRPSAYELLSLPTFQVPASPSTCSPAGSHCSFAFETLETMEENDCSFNSME